MHHRPQIKRLVRLVGFGCVIACWPGGAQAQRSGSEPSTAEPLSSAHGQPLFGRPLFLPLPAVVDYARYYATPEDCLAALPRVRDSALWGEPMLRRVTEFGADRPDQPEPPAVVAVARACVGRFSVATAPAADLPLLYALYLHAAHDSLAEAALARGLALLPVGTLPDVRLQWLERALTFALEEARPARVIWAEQLLEQMDKVGGRRERQVQVRLTAYGRLLKYAATVYDTARLDHYVRAALVLLDSLPEQDRRAIGDQVLYYQRLRALARGDSVLPPEQWAAMRVPPVEATFWFRRPDSLAPRPTPGRASLVTFVDAANLRDDERYPAYALLRAVRERFGEQLDITLVTHTHGYFRNYPPLTPAAEAERLRHYFLEYLRLPGAFAVEVTPFTTLPAPDGRRVEQPPPSPTRYQHPEWSFGLEGPPHTHRWVTGYLVDPEGTVLAVIENLGEDTDLVLAAITGWLARVTPKS